MRIKYKQFEIRDAQGALVKIYRPILRIIFKKGNCTQASNALVDSGADLIILPVSLGKYFEVPFEKGQILPVLLADGQVGKIYKITYSIHQINILCNGVKIKEPIAFSEGQETPLLGQDFFKYFRILFDRKKKYFDIKSNK